MNNITIKKNYLPKQQFKKLKDLLMDYDFPWFYASFNASPNDTKGFHFFHLLYNNDKVNSDYYDIVLNPILKKQKYNKLIRAKCNLYTLRDQSIKSDYHIDNTFAHKVLLYSINTNNGFTLFENGQKIQSIENQLIIFDGLMKHCSVSQTDQNIRVNININLL